MTGLKGSLRFLPALAAVVFLALVASRAWISDDAFITLRTLDNAVNGYGLRWNVAERVQAYTHPLWALLLLVPYAVTREPFFTTLAVALVTTGAVTWMVGRLCRDAAAATLALITLTLSNAFLDYSTSGLENPLAHLILLWFAWEFFREPAERSLRRLALAAAALLLVRMDLTVLVLPALLMAAWRMPIREIVRAALTGAAPVLAWTTYSLIYYGFPFPNTAYAKLNTGVTAAELVPQGLFYLLDALSRDPLTILTCVAAIVAGLAGYARPHGRAWAAGIAAYLGYIVWIGGDYMTGRFLTSPFLASVLLFAIPGPSLLEAGSSDLALASAERRRRWLTSFAALGVACALLAFVWPVEKRLAILKQRYAAGPQWAREPALMFRFISDQRVNSTVTIGAVLTSPDHQVHHAWAEMGREIRQSLTQVWINWGAIGMLGYYGGPRLHIVDPPALGDPLLSRLPAKRPWFPGHFDRELPAGYMDSVRLSGNLVVDPRMHEYYEDLREIVRGPIWSLSRFRTILSINLRRRSAPR
jgi:arabinofuranosyltransferase